MAQIGWAQHVNHTLPIHRSRPKQTLFGFIPMGPAFMRKAPPIEPGMPL